MNLYPHIKRLRQMLWVAVVAGAVPWGYALNYTDSDLLLILRKDGFNDLEIDLGPVTNYVGLAQGTQKAVTYDMALAQSNFNGSLAGVGFSLIAATASASTAPRVWVTDVYTTPVPTEVTLSKFSQIRSKINAIGLQATLATSSNAAPALIAAGEPSSFTYIASEANLVPANSLGGLTGFPIEVINQGTSSASLAFYEVQISTASPKPPAQQIGSFAVAATGAVSFTAGSAPVLTSPHITGLARQGNTSTIHFTSVSGVKYQLFSSSSITGTFSAVGDALTGNGSAQTITDTSSDAFRFYLLQATH